MRRSFAALGLLFAFISGCSRTGDDLFTDRSELALIQSEREGFYFVSPIAPWPLVTGTFAASVDPLVEISPLDAAGNEGAPIASYTRTTGPGEVVHIDHSRGQYGVPWRTADFGVTAGSRYRVRVSVPDGVLGIADAYVIGAASEHTGVDRTRYFPVLAGSTAPIKFRIDMIAVDRDEDGVVNWLDNCGDVANTDQLDDNADGLGNACQCLNVDCADTNPCTVDLCEPSSGCTHAAAPDGAFEGSISTGCGIGACAATGATECRGGEIADSCTPGAPAPNDPPNGIDDDCDGETDDDAAENHPPRFITTPSLAAFPNVTWIYNAGAIDPDPGDVLSYSIVSAPAGTTIDPFSGYMSWRPPAAAAGSYPVTIRVVDLAGADDLQSFTLDVELAPNWPPSITSTPTTEAVVGQPWIYPLSFLLPRGTEYWFEVTSGPSGMSFTGSYNAPELSWTPSAGQVGDHTVSIVLNAYYFVGYEVITQTFTISVDADGIITNPPRRARMDTLYTYDVNAIGRGLPFNFLLTLAPAGMNIEPASGLIQWTPGPGNSPGEGGGNNQVIVSVQDAAGIFGTQSYNVFVEAPPVIHSSPRLDAYTGATYRYEVIASAINTGALTYALTTAPAGMTIGATNGLISWLPDYSVTGSHPVVVRVTDALGLTATQSFTVTVNHVNRPPQLVSGPPATQVYERASFTHDLDATDPDGDPITYALSFAPAGMTVDSASGLISWTPSAADIGFHTIGVSATDPSGAFAGQLFVLEVLDVPEPPSIISVPATTADPGVRYTYQIQVADPDPAEIFLFELESAPAGMIVSSSGLIEWTPAASAAGNHAISIRVEDDEGFQVRQSYMLTVNPPPAADQPPVITSLPVTDVDEHVTYVYQVTATDPDPLSAIVFELRRAPSGMTIDPASGLITWSPGQGQLGFFDVQVAAISGALSAVQDFFVEVHDVEDPPRFTSVPVTTATEDQPYTYAFTFVDPDAGEFLTLEVLVMPSGMTVESSPLRFSWTPRHADVGANPVSLRITDSTGRSDRQDFDIIVAASYVAPSITSTPPATIMENERYEYRVQVSDGDEEDVHVFALTAGPAGMVIDPASGILTWTPSLADRGDHPVTITVTDQGGLSASQSFTLSVIAEAPPLDPVTIAPALDTTGLTRFIDSISFLYTGPNRVQRGVSPETIEPLRAAVIRGRVLARDGSPLSGARITIDAHPELGHTLSRADGAFDLVVNGGGNLRVHYELAGHLSADRFARVAWREFLTIPDVVLIPLDGEVTTVDLAATTVQVARGTAISDNDGTRRATVLFMPGTSASLVLPDGTTETLSSIDVRATEYTVGATGPAAMPGPLPPHSGYTYAVELSVDEAMSRGARSVVFGRPVMFYVENFLGIRVGTDVPVGTYDRASAAWVPEDNGRVIGVLSTSSGLAELDVDGSGIAADAGALAALGITVEEQQAIAANYSAGQSVWRAPFTHFTPGDCNFPYWCIGGCSAPGQPSPRGDNPETNKCEREGSILECENQVLGERIDVAGTPFSLNYRSDRTPGRVAARTLDIPLSGATIPANLSRIDLEIQVAGQLITQSFPPNPNQTHRFIWNGLDGFGRTVLGQVKAVTRVGYAYPSEYVQPANQQATFANPGYAGVPVSASRARQDMTMWQEAVDRTLGTFDARAFGLGGWSLDVQHAYDAESQTLFLGDGRQVNATNANLQGGVSTVVGSGSFGSSGDGGPATSASIGAIMEIIFDAAGNMYFSDLVGNRVRRVDTRGIITTVAGAGTGGFSGDGGPAVDAQLLAPRGIAVDAAGNLYIADSGNNRVRRVDTAGVITTVIGTGDYAFNGHIQHAATVNLDTPADVAIARDGTLYVADAQHNIVRKVLANGPGGSFALVLTAAGGGSAPAPGYGDGGNAQLAFLLTPHAIALDDAGNLFIADTNHNRIRVVDAGGTIRNYVGGGTPADNLGDGGPAEAARIFMPGHLALDRAGNLYFDDGQSFFGDILHHRIRKVATDGTISTVAGNGVRAPGDDGGRATATSFDFPGAVAIDNEDRLYVADASFRIRRIRTALPPARAEVELVSPEGTELYRFDAAGRHLETIDTLHGGRLYRFEYDAFGRLVSIEDFDGNTTTIDRDGAGRARAIIGPYGHRTALDVGSDGWLASLENSLGQEYLCSYADGLLTSFTDPRGATSTIEYDALGRLERDLDAAGGSTTLTRVDLPNGYEVRQVTALGRTTIDLVERTANGEQRHLRTMPDGTRFETIARTDGTVETRYPDGSVTTQTIGPDPRFEMVAPLASTIVTRTPGGVTRTMTHARDAVLSNYADPLSLVSETNEMSIGGRTVTTTYEGATRTLTRVSAAGRETVTSYDAAGRILSLQSGNLEPLQLAYDARGRLSSMTQGSRSLSFTYNASGELAEITDPLLQTRRFVYDDVGRVISHQLSGGRTIQLGYDARGNLTGVTPPAGLTHAFEYSPIGLQTAYVPPAVGLGDPRTEFVYDLDRDLVGVIAPDLTSASYVYDAGGRLSSIGIGRGAFTRTYDSAGRVASIVSPGGQELSFVYDGPLTLETRWSGVVAGALSRTYDSSFRVAGEAVNGGAPVAFQYDGDGLVTAAGALTLTRDAQTGLLSGTALAGVTDVYSYDGFGDLIGYSAQANGSPVYETAIVRDQVGRVSLKTENIGGQSRATAYTYDADGRLTDVSVDAVITEHYEYDDNDNRVVFAGVGDAAWGWYDAQDRLLQYGEFGFVYTADGKLAQRTSLTSGETTTYDYDELGNLAGVVLPDGRQIEYVIDGRNRRVGKRAGGVLERGFIYRDDLSPVAELDGLGNVVSQFVYGSDPGVPDYLIRAGNIYRIISDQLGSVRVVIEVSTGVIVQELDYDSFGQVVADTNPGFQPFGFAGGLYDPDTGLVRFGRRDYDAFLGRWTAKDPILFEGGRTNLYVYVGNDPVNRIDLAGESECTTEIMEGCEEGCRGTCGGALDFACFGLCVSTAEAVEFATDWGDGGGGFFCGGHKKNKRPSSKEKHEKGDERRKRDRGGEKADDKRQLPRVRPKKWKGPWPPS